jgi:hypothetical protein
MVLKYHFRYYCILFIYNLFYDAVSNADYVGSNSRMTGKGNGKDVEGSGRGLMCNPGIFLE